MPTIASPLLSVREVSPADAFTLFELLSDPAVAEHVSPPPPSADAFAGFAEWARREREAGKMICFAIVPKGLDQAIGIIQVRRLDPAFVNAEWGFAMGRAFWATGLFIDAANLVAEFAFATLKVHRLEARAVCRNGRGNGALQKLGARAEAVMEQAFIKNGHSDTQFLWTLTEEDWRQRPLLRAAFSATEVTAKIAEAVRHTRTIVERHRDSQPSEPPPLYPFYVVECGTRGNREG